MKNFAVAVVALVLLGSVGPAPVLAGVKAVSTRVIAAKNLDTIIKAQMKRRGIPGMQVAVIDHGRVVFLRAYGTADLQSGTPVTLQTAFPINSATKAFTGVACMQLVEQGKMDLNAPVSTYLDDLPQSWRAVTIRQLMTHMSGLPDIIDTTGATIEGGG